MNKLIIFGFCAFLFTACIDSEVEKVEYHSTTMMGKTMYTITKDSVVTSFKGRGEPWTKSRATSSSEWTSLMEALAELNVTELPTYEAPTDKRSTDAAAFGTLFVTVKDSTFKSKAFDNFDSHDSYQPVMDEVEKIVKKSKDG